MLVGDHRQLQAIGQGGLVPRLYLQARPEQKAALTEIVRQRESWAREAVKQIGRGEPAEALPGLRAGGEAHHPIDAGRCRAAAGRTVEGRGGDEPAR